MHCVGFAVFSEKTAKADIGPMKSKLVVAFATFLAVLTTTMAAVLLFFQPITRGDTSIVDVHPVIGVLAYVGLCTWIFLWAARATNSSYKAAFVLIATQAALIIDLTVRGERGIVTGLAGIAMLVGTWTAVAFVHQFLCQRMSSNADHA